MGGRPTRSSPPLDLRKQGSLHSRHGQRLGHSISDRTPPKSGRNRLLPTHHSTLLAQSTQRAIQPGRSLGTPCGRLLKCRDICVKFGETHLRAKGQPVKIPELIKTLPRAAVLLSAMFLISGVAAFFGVPAISVHGKPVTGPLGLLVSLAMAATPPLVIVVWRKYRRT
jgi:hypothetical protein